MELSYLDQFNKTVAIHAIMKVEGGEKYTDIKADAGRETRYGVTKATAYEPEYRHLWEKYNWNGDMRTLPGELAFEIYDLGWWQRLRCDDLVAIHPLLAMQVLDIGVNAGRPLAGRCLQRILNAFNLQQKRYEDLTVDGVLGGKTVAALRSLVKSVGQDSIINVITILQSLQNVHYLELCERKESQELFFHGWTNRVKASIMNLARFVLKIK